MCGIAGIYNIKGKSIDKNLLEKMTKIIRHRGPDDEGYLLINSNKGYLVSCYHEDTMEDLKKRHKFLYDTEDVNIGFGFRRLSILDLSINGHQPMANEDGTVWIIFNGEIYNYIELRQELIKIGYNFRTNTDTEVIIYAYEVWGEECLKKFNGMWAFALWDNKKKKLFCARDRFGVKPFSYYFDGETFIFGSEIKQILIHNIDKSLNYKMIYRSLKLASFLIYSDETFFENIKNLPHSHYLTIENGKLEIKKYYDLDINNFEKNTMSFQEAVEKYREIFTDAVRIRMRSDVEVGSCLSGGLDSSAIVVTAAKYTDKQFKTFSSYYTHIPRYDERKYINCVVQKINGKSYFISPEPKNVIEDLERIIYYSDYPVMGSSFISQYYVMKLAKSNGVTVLLDGQGSDEITAGYNHAFYRYYADLLLNFKIGNFLKEYPKYLRYNQKGNFISKIIKTILVAIFKESTLYKEETKRNFINPLTIDFNNADNLLNNIIDLNISKLSNFLYNLLMTTSIQTLLHYEDRNSMAFSLESRVPFLDYRLVEFAFSLPSNYKINSNNGKYIHREALKDIIPTEIYERKDKVNFASPGENFWLRNEMNEYFESIFFSEKFRGRGIYDIKLLEKKYKEYMKGNNKYGELFWKLLNLELWFKKIIDKN